jgi:ketosteroid isomerase-like protein
MAKAVNLTHLLLFIVLYGAAWPNLLAQGSGDAASPGSTVHTAHAGPRTPSGDDSTAVKEAIKKVYAAFSAGDAQEYRTLLTEDYLLLENGELLDIEGDVAMMPAPDSGYQRTDVFDFRSVKIHDDIAYAVYFLKSEIKDRKGSRNREWLESAILLRLGPGWRMALLHSTRITESGG